MSTREDDGPPHLLLPVVASPWHRAQCVRKIHSLFVEGNYALLFTWTMDFGIAFPVLSFLPSVMDSLRSPQPFQQRSGPVQPSTPSLRSEYYSAGMCYIPSLLSFSGALRLQTSTVLYILYTNINHFQNK